MCRYNGQVQLMADQGRILAAFRGGAASREAYSRVSCGSGACVRIYET